jgi:hypothetical protein
MFPVSRVWSTLYTTVRIAAGVGFENRLPGGNAFEKYDNEINEMFIRTSQAPNRS